ncbi:MAG: hypothetical protein LBJ36_02000 [Synergistaceae bacterium]|jgi:hypothetical protein|nr:hypothetical protein [Synergistaceae bacterium]
MGKKSIDRDFIEKLKNEELSGKNKERLGHYLDLLYEQLAEFDLDAVEDERHLRALIMDRVLETAVEFFAIKRVDNIEDDTDDDDTEKFIRLKDLPEKTREEHLNKIMLKILDNYEGPGPALRHSVARLILDYRLLSRLKETLTTLDPSSVKHERVLKGIRHVESQMAMGMLFLHIWPTFKDNKQKKEFQEIRKKVLNNALENPEAFIGKE